MLTELLKGVADLVMPDDVRRMAEIVAKKNWLGTVEIRQLKGRTPLLFIIIIRGN